MVEVEAIFMLALPSGPAVTSPRLTVIAPGAAPGGGQGPPGMWRGRAGGAGGGAGTCVDVDGMRARGQAADADPHGHVAALLDDFRAAVGGRALEPRHGGGLLGLDADVAARDHRRRRSGGRARVNVDVEVRSHE